MLWIPNNDRGRHPRRVIGINGRRLAVLAAGSMIAFGALTLPLSASAQAPPVPTPNDPRCIDKPENIPEDVFFLNVNTPADFIVGPGSAIGSWYSDETNPNTNPAPTFVLTGPGTNVSLPPTLDSHDLTSSFDATHKECRHQVNITTTIPATASGGGPYAPGNYKVTLTASDSDELPDRGMVVWTFTVAAPPPSPSPSPSPTSGTSGAGTGTTGSGSSPTSQVQAAATTGPGLPNTGSGPRSSGPDRVIGAGVLLAMLGAAGLWIARSIRRTGRPISK